MDPCKDTFMWAKHRRFITSCNNYIGWYKNQMCNSTANISQECYCIYAEYKNKIESVMLSKLVTFSEKHLIHIMDYRLYNKVVCYFHCPLSVYVLHCQQQNLSSSTPVIDIRQLDFNVESKIWPEPVHFIENDTLENEDMDDDYKNFIKETILFRLKQRNEKMNNKYQYVIQDDKKKKKEEAEMLYGKENADDILGMEAKIQRDYNYYCDRYDPRIIEVCFSK